MTTVLVTTANGDTGRPMVDLLAGVDDSARNIVGQPLITVEQFIEDNRALFELHYPTAAA
jgi:hypothetical protein